MLIIQDRLIVVLKNSLIIKYFYFAANFYWRCWKYLFYPLKSWIHCFGEHYKIPQMAVISSLLLQDIGMHNVLYMFLFKTTTYIAHLSHKIDALNLNGLSHTLMNSVRPVAVDSRRHMPQNNLNTFPQCIAMSKNRKTSWFNYDYSSVFVFKMEERFGLAFVSLLQNSNYSRDVVHIVGVLF